MRLVEGRWVLATYPLCHYPMQPEKTASETVCTREREDWTTVVVVDCGTNWVLSQKGDKSRERK